MPVQQADSLPRQEVKAGTGTEMQVLIGSDQGPNFAMRRFIMGEGGGMPRHTNTVEHEQYVLCGRAAISVRTICLMTLTKSSITRPLHR